MSPSGDNLITLRNEGGVVIAAFTRGTFKEEKQILVDLERLGEIIDARSNVLMVIDLTNVEYLSSAGLGRMVALLKKAVGGGGNLFLCGLNGEIEELFQVMRLTQIFQIFPSTEEAIAAMATA